MVYYNDFEPACCQWLRNLMAASHIPEGVVDERDIKTIQATGVVGYRQCHWFAGVGGWPLALRLAGWGDRPVWTASLPCQPFSQAGKGKGEADERHLWPVFFALVSQLRPDTLFGEQVASAAGYAWLDGVRGDLEAAGYTFGAADLPAGGTGAPHVRQRLFWVAARLADVGPQPSRQLSRPGEDLASHQGQGSEEANRKPGRHRESGWLGHSEGSGCHQQSRERGVEAGSRLVGGGESGGDGRIGGLEHSQSHGRAEGRAESDGGSVAGGCGEVRLGEPSRTGLPRWQSEPGDDGSQCEATERTGSESCRLGDPGSHQRHEDGSGSPPPEFDAGWHGQPCPWGDYLIIPCRDGKVRRIGAEPGAFPLSYGIPSRVGPLLPPLAELGYGPADSRRIIRAARRNRNARLKGYGNAIVPHAAALFVRAFLEAEHDLRGT